MSELKRCPFCGGEAIIYEDEENSCYMIGCRERCAVEPLTEWCESKQNAIAQWNYRKPMERIVEQLEKEMGNSYSAKAEFVDGMNYTSANVCCGEIDAYEKAIEIVKEKGGIHEHEADN